MEKLPEGWVECQLRECVDILDSKRVPVNNTERTARVANKTTSELYPYYGATGQVGFIDGYLFDEELVALGEDGVPFLDSSKDKAYMLRGKTWVNNHAHVLRRSEGFLNNQYLCYYLNQSNYLGYVNGATRLKLTQTNMKKVPIRIAPLTEQTRIVEKLDDLLGQITTIQSHLNKLPEIIKQFRQSVLAAAVSGQLTEEWRNGEPTNWQSLTIGNISTVETGKTPKRTEPSYWDKENTPWLTSSVTGEPFCKRAEQFVSDKAVSECKLKVFPVGTLLLAMYGEGKTRGQVTELKIAAACNQACAAITINESVAIIAFIKLRLMENYVETRKAAAGGNQPNLNLNKVRDIPIELPSLDEQLEIVRQVTEYFALADTLKTNLKNAKAQVDNLTQSILAKAFRGELVEQQAGDEPASALLEKIAQARAEAEALEKAAKKATRSRKKANA